MRVILTKEDCYCKLVDFYEKVALKAGLIFDDNSLFDCCKILVTKRVQMEISSYYHDEEQISGEYIGTLFACYGPKAILDKNRETPYIAEVQDGFIVCGEKTEG